MNESLTNDTNAGQLSRVLLTLDEARDVLRISKWSLRKLINQNRLKPIHIGTRRLIAADDLRALLDELRQEGADQHGR